MDTCDFKFDSLGRSSHPEDSLTQISDLNEILPRRYSAMHSKTTQPILTRSYSMCVFWLNLKYNIVYYLGHSQQLIFFVEQLRNDFEIYDEHFGL